MLVKFKTDITHEGVLLAKAGSTGFVKRLVGSTKYHVAFDTPLNASYSEAVVSMNQVEVIEGGLKHLVNRVIRLEDIDIGSYELFKQQCDEIKGVIDPVSAVQYAIQAATIAAYLSTYKSMLKYTEEKQDAELKKIYSIAISQASGSSQDKREAIAKQDPNYLQKLEELASIKAAQIYINSAYDYAINMYYLFKEVYSGEKRALMSTDPRDQ